MTFKNAMFILLYAAFTSAALLLFKYGSTGSRSLIGFQGGKLSLNINAFYVFGILLYGISFLLYTFLISRFNLGEIIPLTTGLVYAVVFGASAFLFKEKYSLLQISGVVVILAGITMVELSHKR